MISFSLLTTFENNARKSVELIPSPSTVQPALTKSFTIFMVTLFVYGAFPKKIHLSFVVVGESVVRISLPMQRDDLTSTSRLPLVTKWGTSGGTRLQRSVGRIGSTKVLQSSVSCGTLNAISTSTFSIVIWKPAARMPDMPVLSTKLTVMLLKLTMPCIIKEPCFCMI